MAPIRVALIGASANESMSTAWASKAHLPYLLSPRGQDRFKIVGLLNSSVEGARAAIEHFDIPGAQHVRAYTSPEELAADPDVDMVVCSVRVTKHYETVRPSVEAGKHVLVEWPLAENASRARELADLAKKAGGKTAVAIQARLSPTVVKVKEVIESGAIGKVVNSEMRFTGLTQDSHVVPVGLEYFADLKWGGNPYTIWLGHAWDPIQFVLGELQDIHALLRTQQPTIKVMDANKQVAELQSNVPDLAIVTASLPASPHVREDATMIVEWRKAAAFPDPKVPSLEWTISGEKGNLRVLLPEVHWLNMYGGAVEIHDLATGEIKPLHWQWTEWQDALPEMARNIGALYEAFAEGDESKYASFETAFTRHDQLDSMLKRFHTM